MVYTNALLASEEVRALEDGYALRLIADYRNHRLSSQKTSAVMERANRFVTRIEGETAVEFTHTEKVLVDRV
jgi:hypothetical protein